MNPLIGPKIDRNAVLIMARQWVRQLYFYVWPYNFFLLIHVFAEILNHICFRAILFKRKMPSTPSFDF